MDCVVKIGGGQHQEENAMGLELGLANCPALRVKGDILFVWIRTYGGSSSPNNLDIKIRRFREPAMLHLQNVKLRVELYEITFLLYPK